MGAKKYEATAELASRSVATDLIIERKFSARPRRLDLKEYEEDEDVLEDDVEIEAMGLSTTTDEGEDKLTATREDYTFGSKPRFATIKSIHWFAQHNGARQWLLFEEENAVYNPNTGLVEPSGTTTLKAFDGSLSKPGAYYPTPDDQKPSRTLVQYLSRYNTEPLAYTDSRHDGDLSISTQSQSFGGRIYLVNGYDEPLVFDGDHCERAGFADSPPAPSAAAGDVTSSLTFNFNTCDGTDYKNDLRFGAVEGVDTAETLKPLNIGFWGLHQNVTYFGLGSYSDAEIGGGGYFFPLSGDDERSAYTADEHWPNMLAMKYNFFLGSQIEPRVCGWQYKVTYVNERGQESEASPSSSLATIENGTGGAKYAAHGKCVIGVNLPIGPKECVARRIYRTKNCYSSNGNLSTRGRQKTFYFLDEVSDNMTKVYMDGHPDSALGSMLDSRDLGNFPPRTKYLAAFKNTMFAAGSDFNELHYSAPMMPEVFPKDNVISVGDDDGGPITGIKATKNALVVFKSRGIYLVKGSPGSGFVAQTLNKDIGCIAPNSIAEIPGLGLAFLSEKSVYLLEGALENTGSITSVVNIGGEIPNFLERINHAAAVKACSSVYLRDKEYWIACPIDGSKENNICFIYHYEVGSWSVRHDFPINCMLSTKDHRGYLMMGSHNSSDPDRAGILVYTRGASTKGKRSLGFTKADVDASTGSPPLIFDTVNVPIESIYETVSNDYSSVFQNFRPAHIMAYAVGYGDNGLDVDTRVNRSIDKIRTSKQTSEQQDPNERYPVYGSAAYGKDRWIAYRPTVLRYDVSTSHRGPVRELSISFASSNNNKIEIIGYDLEAKVGEQRRIKPLNKALRPSGR